MKILAISCSPRRNGNTVAMLSETLDAAAAERAETVCKSRRERSQPNARTLGRRVFAMRAGWLLGLVFVAMLAMAGCASMPDAIVIPLDPSADPTDVESLQSMLNSDSRVTSCLYYWTNEAASGHEAWFEVRFPASGSRSDFDVVLERIEGHPAFSRVVQQSDGPWWRGP